MAINFTSLLLLVYNSDTWNYLTMGKQEIALLENI